jgi:kynurenine 3-monooxygenase
VSCIVGSWVGWSDGGCASCRLTLRFNSKVTRITEDGEVTVVPTTGSSYTVKARLVIGADGAFSAVRSAMMRLCRMDFAQQFIGHGYKELEIPPTPEGKWRLPSHNALHIWPREEFMLIGLPNPDGSFTCTLFAPTFPDAVPLLPELVGQYKRNPTGALAMIRVKPWNFKDRVVLMGDAAHAIVPFFGQVCCFECLVFCGCPCYAPRA